MGKRIRVILLLASATWLLGAGAGLLACGDGDGETDGPSLVGEASALLGRADLSELTEAEWEVIGSALREALGTAGTVRVTSSIDKQDFVFGPDGRVLMVRTIGTIERGPPEAEVPEVSKLERISVYLEPPAQFCDGEEDSELLAVQKYEYAFDEWQVSVSAIPVDEVPFGVVLSRMDLDIAEDAGFLDEGRQRLRGLTVPYPQPADPEATVTVWVDLEDMRISRLAVTFAGTSGASYPFGFDYDAPVQIEVPPEPVPPDCVPVE